MQQPNDYFNWLIGWSYSSISPCHCHPNSPPYHPLPLLAAQRRPHFSYAGHWLLSTPVAPKPLDTVEASAPPTITAVQVRGEVGRLKTRGLFPKTLVTLLVCNQLVRNYGFEKRMPGKQPRYSMPQNAQGLCCGTGRATCLQSEAVFGKVAQTVEDIMPHTGSK